MHDHQIGERPRPIDSTTRDRRAAAVTTVLRLSVVSDASDGGRSAPTARTENRAGGGHLTDAELLHGAQAGSADAWRALYQRVLPSVWRQAYALVADVHAAEDVASEAMVALLRGLDNLDADGVSLAAWLRTVVHRKAMDHHRRAFRQRANLPMAPESPEDCSVDDGPERPMEEAEASAQVHRTLERLSDRQRTVLHWKYADRVSVREIAERLGETEKAVESALYRARQEFRRVFELGHSRPRGGEHPEAEQTLDFKPKH